MKRLKSALPLVLVLFLAASFAPPKGFTYKSTEGKMSIVFPGEFQTDETKGENNVTIKTSCTVNDQTYFVSYTLHELEITEHERMAEVSYDSFIKAVEGELISKTEWKIKDHAGLKTVMNMAAEDTRLEYRVILVGNIQYQVVVLAANSFYNEKAAAAFFKTFKLIE